jgi:hypothetical protein
MDREVTADLIGTIVRQASKGIAALVMFIVA